MKRAATVSRRQRALFPPVADKDLIATETKPHAISALAELLLEAAGHRVEEGEIKEGKDELEDHA